MVISGALALGNSASRVQDVLPTLALPGQAQMPQEDGM